MYEKVKKLYKAVSTVEKYIIGAWFLVLCALIFYTIIDRMFKGQGIHWLEEFSRGTLIMTTYFCGCIATGEDRLTKLSLVTDAMPKRAALFMKTGTNIFSAAFMLWIGYHCVRNTMKVKGLGMMTTSLGVGTWVLYAPMMVAMLALGLRLIVAAWDCIHEIKRTPKHQGKMTNDELFQELLEKGE